MGRKGEEGEERGKDNGREGEHKRRGEKRKRGIAKLGEKRREKKNERNRGGRVKDHIGVRKSNSNRTSGARRGTSKIDPADSKSTAQRESTRKHG